MKCALFLKLLTILSVCCMASCGDEPDGGGKPLRWTVMETGQRWKSSLALRIDPAGDTVTQLCDRDFDINQIMVTIDDENIFYDGIVYELECPGFFRIAKHEKILVLNFEVNPTSESRAVRILVHDGNVYAKMTFTQPPTGGATDSNE